MRRFMIYLAAAAILAGCAHGEQPDHRRGPRRASSDLDAGFAQARPQRRAPAVASAAPDAVLFASFDRDGDLLISASELAAGLTREFARADANHDHIVSPAEYDAWSIRALGGPYEPRRLEVDSNADGEITFEEFSAEFSARARRYDSNGDGVIEHADLVRAPPHDDLILVNPDESRPAGARP